MLTSKDIANKPAYLAALLSKPCPIGRPANKCAIRNLRSMYVDSDKEQIEEELVAMREESVASGHHNSADVVLIRLEDHFRCMYES